MSAEARIAPAVHTGRYVPIGPRTATATRPYFLNHRLAEGVYR